MPYGSQFLGAQLQFIDITPAPIFARFKRTHDRMGGSVKVLCGMFVFGRIATTNMTAGETHAQMHPRVAHLEALFTTFGVGLRGFDVLMMCTHFRHFYVPFARLAAGIRT